MFTNDNRRPGRQPRNGGKDYSSTNSAKVIQFPRYIQKETTVDPVLAYRAFTHALVMAQHREGRLDPAVVEAMLVGVGLHP